jgi:hypothetical protein
VSSTRKKSRRLRRWIVKSQLDPWNEIAPQPLEGKLRARRVDATHPHDFYWGLDAKGQRLLLFRPPQKLDCNVDLPTIHGISIELEPDHFAIRLINPSDTEIFTTLCWSLVDRARSLPSGGQVLDALVAHLVRWQKFLGKSSRGLLSDEEVRGLYCELCFLQERLLSRYGAEAINYWHGPSGYPQDFAIGTTLFEVKSHMAGSPPVVAISSAEQLWHTTGELFLVVYTLGEGPKALEGAFSLRQRVDQVRQFLPDTLLDVFEDRLIELGYTDHPEYDKHHYVVSQPDIFQVIETFPRITSDAVLLGVCKVRYAVELAACIHFKCEPDWDRLGGINGH